MKTILISISILFASFYHSQMIIGGATGTAGANTASVLLDFSADGNKGLVLPYVRVVPTSPTPRTIILDATNPNGARVKYYNENTVAGTNGWTDLSGQDADISQELNDQPNTSNSEIGKVIIGANSSNADGVLVLESQTKAMVLPMVTDVQLVLNPIAGMMVYVNNNDEKRLAVFNGNKWSFWKP